MDVEEGRGGKGRKVDENGMEGRRMKKKKKKRKKAKDFVYLSDILKYSGV